MVMLGKAYLVLLTFLSCEPYLQNLHLLLQRLSWQHPVHVTVLAGWLSERLPNMSPDDKYCRHNYIKTCFQIVIVMHRVTCNKFLHSTIWPAIIAYLNYTTNKNWNKNPMGTTSPLYNYRTYVEDSDHEYLLNGVKEHEVVDVFFNFFHL